MNEQGKTEVIEREEMINILSFFEGKAESYYESMDEEKLRKYYADYLKKGEDL